MGILDDLRVGKEVTLLYKGHIVLDSKFAKVLEEIERKGSLLAAARSQGVSYSWVWSRINKVEELLGKEIIEVRRGGSKGGGAVLTELGRSILSIYKEALVTGGKGVSTKEAVLAGGYDPLLAKLLEPLTGKVEVNWTGSLGGLGLLIMGNADIVGLHLYDPETGEQNLPFLYRFWLADSVILVRGFEREIGLIFRKGLEIESVSDIIRKGLKYVNRIKGSGTRFLADCLLRLEARMLGYREHDLSKLVKGYEVEVRTPIGVAKKIAKGEADVGFGVRSVAEDFDLSFMRLFWESYDFAIPKDSVGKSVVSDFLEIIRSDYVDDLIASIEGYRAPSDIGRVIHR